MKILITGCSGFIGIKLSELLHSNNHFIVAVDKFINKNLICDKKYKLDIINIDNIPNNISDNIDCIIHLAAEHKDNITPIDLYYKTNYYGTKKIIEFSEKHNINKIIFTSSVAVYGIDMNGSSEKDTPNPFNDYGKSKLMAEKVLNEWFDKNKQRTLIIIRPTVVFGPRNRGNVYSLISQIINKKFVMIGNGKNKKSLAFIDDLVNFLLLILKLESGSFIYNFSNKPDLKMNELISQIYRSLNYKRNNFRIPKYIGLLGSLFFDLLAKLINYSFNITYIRIKKFVSPSIVSIKRIEKDFPDFKFTNLDEAIDLTIKKEFRINK